MSLALVLSAGGMYGAWEVGVWKALRERFQFDLVVGASAGAWNAWAIAGGASPEDLAGDWLDPVNAAIMQPGLHRTGIFGPAVLYKKAQGLFARFQPRMPFALTMVEVPRLKVVVVRGPEVTWRHLAASCSIPFGFPPVEIEGRYYVDGGFRGALPLWAAQQAGATQAIAVDAINILPFKIMRFVMRPPRPDKAMKVFRIEPSCRLGPLRDGVVWSEANMRRWLEQGECDGTRAATSITM